MPGIPYRIDAAKKLRLAGAYVLDIMLNEPRTFSVVPEGDEAVLAPVLQELHRNTLVRRVDGQYTATKKARDVVEKYQKRYLEFLLNRRGRQGSRAG